MTDPSQFNTDRTHPGRWTITFSNPPINMFIPTTIVELGALMSDIEADPTVKVVVFQAANPDFFIPHLDVAKAAAQPGVLDLWRDFVLRLSSASVVSIAKIRGRTRGIGNEFVLALLWQIFSGRGFPNHFFCDSWVVGLWRADREDQIIGLGSRACAVVEAVFGSPGP